MPSGERPFVHVWRDAVLDSDLPARAKLVAFAVARHADNYTGVGSHPSLATLARYCSLSRSTVQLAIDMLDSCGWIEVERGGLPARANVYSLVPANGRTHAHAKRRATRRKEADNAIYDRV